jgi:hypothetical protein
MNNEKIDVNSTKSNRPGLAGLVEGLLRKFRGFGFMLALAPIAVLYVLAMGLSLSPGVFL